MKGRLISLDVPPPPVVDHISAVDFLEEGEEVSNTRVTKVIYDEGVHVKTIDTTQSEILDVRFDERQNAWKVKHYVLVNNRALKARITTIPAQQLRAIEEWAP